jgi:hypothetical protein
MQLTPAQTLKEEPLPTYEEWISTKDDLATLKKKLEATQNDLTNQKSESNSNKDTINKLKKDLEAALIVSISCVVFSNILVNFLSQTTRKDNESWIDNRLPLQYDKAIVMFINIASQIALDAGKGKTSTRLCSLLNKMTNLLIRGVHSPRLGV